MTKYFKHYHFKSNQDGIKYVIKIRVKKEFLSLTALFYFLQKCLKQ